METTTRRIAIGSLLAGAFTFLGSKSGLAQTQTAGNGASIVATGDVHLGQSVSASQTVRGAGTVSGTGIQVVTNDGRIVATGDVWVNQEAAASQNVEANTHYGEGGGEGAACTPGWYEVKGGSLYFCDEDCNIRKFSCPKERCC